MISPIQVVEWKNKFKLKGFTCKFSYKQMWKNKNSLNHSSEKFFLLISLVGLSFFLNACSGFSNRGQKDLEAQILKTISENPEAIMDSMIAYKKEEERSKAAARQQTFLDLKENNVLVKDSPTLGSTSQDILLLEFSDFQCPFCAQTYKTVKQFANKYDQNLTLVYKHFPIDQIHPEAVPAARASWAANEQGKFWEYHDALFDNQSQLGEKLYVKIAQELDLDLDKFNQDRNSEEANTAIQKDLDLGKKLNIDGTPFIVINGIPLSGEVSMDNLEKTLEQVNKEISASR